MWEMSKTAAALGARPNVLSESQPLVCTANLPALNGKPVRTPGGLAEFARGVSLEAASRTPNGITCMAEWLPKRLSRSLWKWRFKPEDFREFVCYACLAKPIEISTLMDLGLSRHGPSAPTVEFCRHWHRSFGGEPGWCQLPNGAIHSD